MVKLGIISDTHINNYSDGKVKVLLDHLREIFKDVDRVIHAGDVCIEEFLIEFFRLFYYLVDLYFREASAD